MKFLIAYEIYKRGQINSQNKNYCGHIQEHEQMKMNALRYMIKYLPYLLVNFQNVIHIQPTFGKMQIISKIQSLPPPPMIQQPHSDTPQAFLSFILLIFCHLYLQGRVIICPFTPVLIYACYRYTCKTLYHKLITCQHFGKCAQLSFCK